MNKKLPVILLSLSLLLSLLTACGEKPKPPVRIAINPWPGYEFLYLAEQKGFFEKVGLNAKLTLLASLADVQRAYLNGYADGLAGTIIEVVQSQALSHKDLRIILVPDFSNGGDVIVSNKNYSSMAELKGKNIGAEVTSLGIFLLQRALAKAGLTLDDINVKNIEQLRGEESLLNNEIDAFVSYPPTSINILRHEQYHQIFSSAEIPGEIIDTIAVSKDALDANPGFVKKLHAAWHMALEYYKSNPKDAVEIMARREGISPNEFKDVLSDLKILDIEAQPELLSAESSLHESVKQVCQTLVHIKSIQYDCKTLPNIVYELTP